MFDNLKSLEVKGSAWMSIEEVSPGARLLLNPALEANKPYHSAMLKMSVARKRQMALRGDINHEDLIQNRADDVELFPQFVIINWSGIQDEEGEELPFSPELCAEFCTKLPSWIFDRVRNFAATPERFLADSKELSKNSESGSGTS